MGVKDSDNTVNFNMMAAILHYIYFMLQHVGVTPHKAMVHKVCQPGRMLPRDHFHPIYQHPLGAKPNTQTTALWIHSSAIYFKYMIKIYLTFKYTCIRYTKGQKIKS